MTKYDFLVYFKVEGMTEEEAQQNLLTFLKMAKLDFGLTYGITDTDLVEFVTEKDSNI
jgi:hypothetical protein